VHTIKPLDHDFIRRTANETGAIVTIKEHSIIGGLGSAVSEAVGEATSAAVVRVGIKDTFAESGTIEQLQKKLGLDAEAITLAVESSPKRKDRRKV